LLKILIVDDEFLIRVGIKSCIDWEQNGFDVVGLAENGIQALELMDRVLPDIVMTDIKMPNMDGLELIHKIRERFPHVKIIVLSCHNELEFVKRAMKLGAEDYILKLSMEPAALLEVLNKTGELILLEREKYEKPDSVQTGTHINKYVLKEDLFKKFIDNSINFAQLQKALIDIGIQMHFSKAAVICCGIDDYINAAARSRMEDQHLLKFSFLNILEESLSACCPVEISEIENGKYLLLLKLENNFPNASYSDVVKEFCIKAASAVKKYLNISVSFGISDETHDSMLIRERYEEASKAMNHRFYLGHECLVFYSEMTGFTDKTPSLGIQQERSLNGCLESMDMEGAKAIISGFLNSLRLSRCYSPSGVRMAAIELLHSIHKTVKRFDLDRSFLTAKGGQNPVEKLMNTETIMDMEYWFADHISRIAEYMTIGGSKEVRTEIVRIKSYILEHIAEDINLDKAAKISNISRCYFSTVFKKQTGESFTDYVNRIRMEKARELLLTLDLKTYEIAEKVGIPDEAYFSKLFKKFNGISPSKLRSK